jgi:hypothetical protein
VRSVLAVSADLNKLCNSALKKAIYRLMLTQTIINDSIK